MSKIQFFKIVLVKKTQKNSFTRKMEVFLKYYEKKNTYNEI